jgi:hypothetical protein
MGTSGKAVIVSLFFLNILAVCMGYVGIDKLQRYGAPPFQAPNGAMQTMFYLFAPISGRTMLLVKLTVRIFAEGERHVLPSSSRWAKVWRTG